eukprot:SAG11_NODE_9834_length_877_cov_1.437018_1_plen_223_part_01
MLPVLPLVGLLAASCARQVAAAVASAQPAEVASRLANALTADADAFINWEGGFQYGGAMTADGLAAAAAAFPGTEANRWVATLDGYLDRYLQPPSAPGMTACGAPHPYGPAATARACAHAMLEPASFPRYNSSLEATVGDHLGLFPIAYLARHRRRGGGAAAADLAVALNTAVPAPCPPLPPLRPLPRHFASRPRPVRMVPRAGSGLTWQRDLDRRTPSCGTR